jgi:haloalkane dehalogenase
LPASKPFPTALKFARYFRLGSFLVRYFGAFSHAANHFCTKIKRLDKQTKQAYLAPYNDKHSRLAVLRFVQDIPLKPTDPSYDLVHKVGSQLHRLQHIPMLIVWGAKDFVFDDHFLAQWKIFFPKAEVHRYGDAGHYLLEDKGEEVIAVIKTFLSSTP